MKTRKRYSFWKVFWVVLGLNLLFTLLGFIAISVAPVYSKDFDWNKILSWHYLFAQVIAVGFSSVFYYFTVNSYYHLFNRRRSTSFFVRPTVIAVLVLMVYFAANYFLAISKKITISVNSEKIDQ